MKLKKKSSITVLVVVLIFVFCMFLRSYVFGRSFDSFLGNKINKITKVSMMNGNTGVKVSTTDKSEIKQLIGFIDNRKYTKSFNQRRKVGYNYSMILYVGDKEVLTMWNFGETPNINGDRFNLDKTISADDIKSWYDSQLTVK